MNKLRVGVIGSGRIGKVHIENISIRISSAEVVAVADPFFEIANAPDLLSLTPFDAVYYPAENQEHILITPENKVWLMDEIQTGVSPVPDSPLVPVALAILHGAVPNPFNPQAAIRFSLASATRVDLGIYDLSGRLVQPLISGDLYSEGNHQVTWNGEGANGSSLPSGVYLCRLKAGGENQAQRLTLLK